MFNKVVYSTAFLILTAFIGTQSYAFELKQNYSTDSDIDQTFSFNVPSSSFADVQFPNDTYVRAGIAQGDSVFDTWQPGLSNEGSLSVAETGFRHFGRDQYGVGSWDYTSKYDPFTPLGREQQGMYVLAEHSFYNEDSKSITGFARVGRSAGDIAESRNGWSAGFMMKGFFESRPEGQLGFAVSSGPDRANGVNIANDPFEDSHMQTRLEMTYLDKISDNISIQPGIRYTISPHKSNDVESSDSGNGLTAGLRLRIKFK